MAPSLNESTARLIRWLGPWSAGTSPPRTSRHRVDLEGKTAFAAYEIAPTDREIWGVYVITPGMHFLGADDPRMIRFCRVLAACGLLVIVPLVPDLLDLRLRPDTDQDLRAAWMHAVKRARGLGLPKPALFSISFGSLPAITLAADPRHQDEVGTLVLFGGFGDFDAAVRHLLTGYHEGPDGPIQGERDPLNAPAIFRNVLFLLPVPPEHRPILDAAWLAIIHRTWGHVVAFKVKDAYRNLAEAMALTLPEPVREMFLLGCNLRPNALETVRKALSGGAFAFADPRPALARVKAPVVVVHGRDDDVIPWTEAHRIQKGLGPDVVSEVMLTGMYGHTGSSLPDPGHMAREIAALVKVARALMQAPRRR